MEFILCTCDSSGLASQFPLEDIESEQEAKAKAHAVALRTKEGVLVALFTREGKALVGWRVLKDNKLRAESLDTLQDSCGIGEGTYEFIKRQADEMRKAKEKREKQ